MISDRRYSVYIIAGDSGVTYTGMTNNLTRRVYEHKMKQIEGFTRKYNLTKLVFYEHYATATSAIAREKQLKGWSRKRKVELIEATNPSWADLAKDWYVERLPDGELPR
ncbi:MAG: GIY-YIG nuclease family protein [bacterium]|nr:GIY-YIG nuclease family protein [bacterium]